MCVVSNIGDYWKDRLPDQYPWITPLTPSSPATLPIAIPSYVTQQQFDELKKEIMELKKLLQAAQDELLRLPAGRGVF